MKLAKTREQDTVKATVKSILDELGLRDVVSERLRERPDVLDRFGWIAEAQSNISHNPSVERLGAPNESGDDANTVHSAGESVVTATRLHSYATLVPKPLATLSPPKCISTSNQRQRIPIRRPWRKFLQVMEGIRTSRARVVWRKCSCFSFPFKAV